MKKISTDNDGPNRWLLNGPDCQAEYCIGVAADRRSRERAYRLAHNVYKQSGYVSDDTPALGTKFDSDPRTLTLLAETKDGRAAATVTLVFDSSAGLPADELYSPELDRLRAQSRQLVEVTRLAISEEHMHSKVLLVRLFNFIYLFARRVKNFDDFVIEVNPRHVNYYRRLLKFEQIGVERPCPRVQGAPAVLLKLDLALSESEVQLVAGKGASANQRTLYPHFYAAQDEHGVLKFLARRHKPMTLSEVSYFNLQLAAV